MGKTVLVVEDDIKIRSIYQKELETQGYRVFTASTSKEALDYLHRSNLDAIILELEISNGVDLDYLNEFIKLNRNLKVVINSDHPEFKNDFCTWIADAFLIKSSNLTELKSTLKRMLQTNKERETNSFAVI